MSAPAITTSRRPARKPRRYSQREHKRYLDQQAAIEWNASKIALAAPVSKETKWTPPPKEITFKSSRYSYGSTRDDLDDEDDSPVTIERPITTKSRSLAQIRAEPLPETKPLTTGEFLLWRLPIELRQQIYGYLTEGHVVLDKGWKLGDYNESPELCALNLPVLYRAVKPFYPDQSTARIEPVNRRSNTGLMFVDPASYEDYAPWVYHHAHFTLSSTKTVNSWLLCEARRSGSIRNPNCPHLVEWPLPSPDWIRTVHLHMYSYGTPKFRSGIKYQAKYYLGWRKAIAAMAKECVNLQELHYTIDVPKRDPIKADLRQDWAWALLPTADMPSLKTCTVQLNMDWQPEMIWAFEDYLKSVLNKLGRATGIAAIKTAREEHMETEEGQGLKEKWDEFVKWNEDELALIEECERAAREGMGRSKDVMSKIAELLTEVVEEVNMPTEEAVTLTREWDEEHLLLDGVSAQCTTAVASTPAALPTESTPVRDTPELTTVLADAIPGRTTVAITTLYEAVTWDWSGI